MLKCCNIVVILAIAGSTLTVVITVSSDIPGHFSNFKHHISSQGVDLKVTTSQG